MRHFTHYIEPIKQLKREGKNAEVYALLLDLMPQIQEFGKEHDCLPPWYFEQASLALERLGRLNEAAHIIQEYLDWHSARGSAITAKNEMLKRLARLRSKR
jgi:hypothetical protein